MRTLTLKRDPLTELSGDEMRLVVGAGQPELTTGPSTVPRPPTLPVTGCDSLCACVSTGGTTL